jgi:hypothetical protein
MNPYCSLSGADLGKTMRETHKYEIPNSKHQILRFQVSGVRKEQKENLKPVGA